MTGKPIWIKISGKEYQGSFPASFAESLTEMQRGFYRTAALALHGDENIKRLTREELDRFEIVFQVKTGSTEISVDIVEKFENLILEGLKTMPAEYQAALIGFAVLCYFGSKVFDRWCQKAETIAESEKAETDKAERTKQLEIIKEIANQGYTAVPQIAEAVARSAEKLTDSVLRNAAGADSIELAGTRYDAADIAEANRRIKADRSGCIMTGEYRITVVDNTHPDLLKLTLRDSGNEEYTVKMDTSDMFTEDVEKVWEAAKSGRYIPMQISAVLKNGIYEKGFIEEIEI